MVITLSYGDHPIITWPVFGIVRVLHGCTSGEPQIHIPRLSKFQFVSPCMEGYNIWAPVNQMLCDVGQIQAWTRCIRHCAPPVLNLCSTAQACVYCLHKLSRPEGSRYINKTSKLISIVKNNELMSVFLTLDTPTFANHDFQVALGADLVPLTDHPKYIEYLPTCIEQCS